MLSGGGGGGVVMVVVGIAVGVVVLLVMVLMVVTLVHIGFYVASRKTVEGAKMGHPAYKHVVIMDLGQVGCALARNQFRSLILTRNPDPEPDPNPDPNP